MLRYLMALSVLLSLGLAPPAFAAKGFGGGKSAAVTGGASSTDNAIPCFDGTTGQVIKECTTDMVAVQNLDMNGNSIIDNAGNMLVGDGSVGQTLTWDGATGNVVLEADGNVLLDAAGRFHWGAATTFVGIDAQNELLLSFSTTEQITEIGGTLTMVSGSGAALNVSGGNIELLATAGLVALANDTGLVVGHTAQLTIVDLAEFQMLGTAAVDSSMVLGRFSADAVGADFRFFKGRDAAIGTLGIVSTNDNLGQISWVAADDTDFDTVTARFFARVDDGSPADGDIGTGLIWETMAGGGASLTEKMRLANDGELILNNLKFNNNGNQATIHTSGDEAIFTIATGNTTGRMEAIPVNTFGFDIGTTGSKVTCDLANSGSLFHENTNADSTAAILFMCMENASDVYSWNTIHTAT